MKQVTQTLRNGVIEVRDVPVPTLNDGFILVQTFASVISAGTEKSKIDLGKKNLLQKARARPELVLQVLNKLRVEGVSKTLQTVNARLDGPSPLGYSCAGKVIAVGGLVEGIQPGDLVACGGGGYANHAELVTIPKNLAVKIPDGVHIEEAAFATIGAIALQGIRLAKPSIGETFLVIGLGLIGQITTQLLRANGCKVIGTDLDPGLIERASKAYGAIPTTSQDLLRTCMKETSSHGVDGVIVCAGTTSNQPIEVCGEVTRQKGRVVVVGAVRMDVPRSNFFEKEISLVISRSYGPGRYDPEYEEKGNDYPIGYVRFTEQRNMQTFLQLLSERKIEITALITHRFKLDEAAAAYSIIEGKRSEPYLGIILEYNLDQPVENRSANIKAKPQPLNDGQIKLSCIGAGSFATATLLPILAKNNRVTFEGVSSASGRTAEGVAEQFSFSYSSDATSVLENGCDAIVIATRHNSHAELTVDALDRNVNVFVEKPLALTLEQLTEVEDAFASSTGSLMVGFNRRFAPFTVMAKEHVEGPEPTVVNIRVNAGEIPLDHWVHDPAIGGGRLLGEACHFIDLASALTDSFPVKVHAFAAGSAAKSIIQNDNLTISLVFANGSMANILYVSCGSSALNKEYVEVYGNGRAAIIHDFREINLYEGSKKSSSKLPTQDKGHKNMLTAWVNGMLTGQPCVPPELLFANSRATIFAAESLTIDSELATPSENQLEP